MKWCFHDSRFFHRFRDWMVVEMNLNVFEFKRNEGSCEEDKWIGF